jgi:flagellar basal-body rod modification protein FlgD
MAASFGDYAYSVAQSSGVRTADSSSVQSQLEQGRTTLVSSQQTFLTLLTTQLKNQDPLAPTDSSQFVQQTVQMTGVQQQLLTNNLLTALVGKSDGGLNEAAAMLGKTITAATDKTALKDGSAKWDYELGADAKTVKLEVVDSSGKTVFTKDIEGGQTMGDHVFTWDGSKTGTTAKAAEGVYSLKITPKTKTDTSATYSIYHTGTATNVSTKTGETVVTVGGVNVAKSQILTIAAPTATPSTTTTATNTQQAA